MAAPVSDDAFAKYANEHGIVSFDQIEHARKRQADRKAQGQALALADVLIEQAIITPAIRENIENKLQQAGGLRQLGPYKLLKKLGEGGMGAVYLAEDPGAGRQVAIKVLPRKHSDNPEFVTRFRREARATGKLSHANIVAAYAVGEEMGHHYYVMEFCEGEPLDAALKREERLDWDRATQIVLQVSRGLKHAHDNGFLHRDIKPANIFITTDGTAKILDLGLSKNIGEAEQSFLTQTGVALGTPHYISPEQAQGEKEVDGRTDIYSLGATYYHLLTGQTPFQANTAAAIIMKHITEQLPNPQDLRDDIPDAVVHVIERMMAKSPLDRYENCAALIGDLELVVQGKAPSSMELDAGKSSIAVRRTKNSARPARQADPARSHSPSRPSGFEETLVPAKSGRSTGEPPRRAVVVPMVLGGLIGAILIWALLPGGGKTPAPPDASAPAVASPPAPSPQPQPAVKPIEKPVAETPQKAGPVVPPRPEPVRIVLEAENLRVLNKAPASILDVQSPGFQWSRGQHRWFRSEFPNAAFALEFAVEKAGYYRVSLALTRGPDYGRITAALDGRVLLESQDCYGLRQEPFRVDAGEIHLQEGAHELRIAVPMRRGAGAYTAAIDAIILEPLNTLQPEAEKRGQERWKDALNLLALVDLKQDCTPEEWQAVAEGLQPRATKIGSTQKLEIPYTPPEEYDLRCVFSVLKEGEAHDTTLILQKKNVQFCFKAFLTGGSTLCGFELINKEYIDKSPAMTKLPPLRAGLRHTLLAEVRNSGLRGLVDDKVVAEWKTDYSDLSIWGGWRLRQNDILGVGNSGSSIILHELKLIAVSGTGGPKRKPATPAAR
ncbi:MAG TPA: serine/threonine-protein kinase [Planctomycetota bacterium]|nr:serine/threonine-protein kinase [Planctomycetota bacterium]